MYFNHWQFLIALSGGCSAQSLQHGHWPLLAHCFVHASGLKDTSAQGVVYPTREGPAWVASSVSSMLAPSDGKRHQPSDPTVAVSPTPIRLRLSNKCRVFMDARPLVRNNIDQRRGVTNLSVKFRTKDGDVEHFAQQ
jgi:hypothetical protein